MRNFRPGHLFILIALSLLLPASAQPKPRNPNMKQGMDYVHQHDNEKAIASFTKVIAQEPKNADAWYQRAECYARLKQFQRAIADCSKAIELMKSADPLPYKLRAFSYMKTEQYVPGIADYTRVLGLRPNDKEAMENRRIACRLIGKPEPPVIPKKGTYEPTELVMIAQHDANHGHYKAALKKFSDALIYDDKRADTYFRRGEVYFVMEKFPEAIKDLDMAVRLNPKEVNYYYSLGKTYTSMNQYDKAIENFNHVVKLMPNNTGVHMRLGGCYLAIGNKKKAIEEWTWHLKVDPGDDKVIYQRAALYTELKMYPQALKDYNQLVAKTPNDEDMHRRRGEFYMKLHDYKKAIEDFTKTIELDKANAGSVYTLRAQAYQAIGKTDLAAKDLKAAKEFDERI